MQLVLKDEIKKTESLKPDTRFIKSLKLNRRTQELVTSLLAKGFLEAHVKAIIDSYRSGLAMQSYFAVLELHWVQPRIPKKTKRPK